MVTSFNSINRIVSQRDIERIVRENNIIEVARELGLNVGKSVIPCIRKERHVNKNGAPSMSFNLIANTFKCWVCSDVGGDVIDLVMQVKNVDRQKAIEFLLIRSEIKSDSERRNFFKEGGTSRHIDKDTREMIFQEFLSGLEHNRGIELIAFASTKGGTGKTLVVNNIAVILSLITRYIATHRHGSLQDVELIDLDFGKPDQRHLLGIEPELYIEDIFYQNGDSGWKDLRQKTALDNLNLVSACPVRKSNSLYYMKKNEILFMLHNSDALLKLADFGGGTDKDTLDFLADIKSKIFVINPDKASVEAVFNLILSLIYYPLKQRFKASTEVQNLLDEFRKCSRTGMTIQKLREGFQHLDQKRTHSTSFMEFYDKILVPFKREMGFDDASKENPSIEQVRADVQKLRTVVNRVMFTANGKDSIPYNTKCRIYRTFNEIDTAVCHFNGYLESLDELLKTRLFGLIINKAGKEEADAVA